MKTAPWQSHQHPTHAAVITTATGHPIALILDQGSDEATDALARLIASAPELLAALQDAEFLLRQCGANWKEAASMSDSMKRSASDARAALAKALPES